MSHNTPTQFDNVSIVCKANVYFDGKVLSHTVQFGDGTKKTIGLIYPGAYTFNTGAPEKMEIIAGSCKAKLAGKHEWNAYPAGAFFDVPGNSSFDVAVARVCGLFFGGDGVNVRCADKIGNGDTGLPETGMHLFHRQGDLFRLPVFQHRLQNEFKGFKPLVLVLTVRPLRQ